jgi:hypothetical protein
VTPEALTRALSDAVVDAERRAPDVDPLSALSAARRRRSERRGSLTMLAFVVFALLVQADSRVAHGDVQPTSVVASASTSPSAAEHG